MIIVKKTPFRFFLLYFSESKNISPKNTPEGVKVYNNEGTFIASNYA